MEARKKQVTITFELEEWEADALHKMLKRIKDQPTVGKSEFTMSEKVVGRKVMSSITMLKSLK